MSDLKTVREALELGNAAINYEAGYRVMDAGLAALSGLEATVKALVEGLKPFAEASVSYRRGAGQYAKATDSLRIVLANCDRASALVAEHAQEQAADCAAGPVEG